TPNELFYVRTAFPATLAATRPWTVRVGGLVREPRDVGLETLDGLVEPRGAHLLECAGNSDPENYGLISAARWEGILLTAVLDRAQPATRLPRVLVAGVDDDVHPSRTSVPGASWIFALDDLERAGAFLAT